MRRPKPAPAPDRSVAVQLGARVVRVPALNVGQWFRLQSAFDAFAGAEAKDAAETFAHGLTIARILFERAEPAVEIDENLECTPAQLQAAQTAIFEFSRFTQGKAAAANG